MKKRVLNSVIVGLVLLSACVTLAELLRPAPPQNGALDSAFGVPALEVPQTAAQRVAQAPESEKPEVARELVRQVAAMDRPGATPFTVSAISQASPDLAAEVAATAVALRPEETLAISKAAIDAVPAHAVAIVAAVSRVAPKASVQVAAIAVAARPQIHAVPMVQVASANVRTPAPKGTTPTPMGGGATQPQSGAPFTPVTEPSTVIPAKDGTVTVPCSPRTYSAP